MEKQGLLTPVDNPLRVQKRHRLDQLSRDGSGDRQLEEPNRRGIASLASTRLIIPGAVTKHRCIPLGPEMENSSSMRGMYTAPPCDSAFNPAMPS
jgi:hypothetical protein